MNAVGIGGVEGGPPMLNLAAPRLPLRFVAVATYALRRHEFIPARSARLSRTRFEISSERSAQDGSHLRWQSRWPRSRESDGRFGVCDVRP
jgi:hypothetical protein